MYGMIASMKSPAQRRTVRSPARTPEPDRAASTRAASTRAASARASPASAATRGLREALTPEAWIDAATDVLVSEGIDHVRVDVLARQLGVTRGSFYWHFRDREDLLRRVLQAWSERATLALTRRLASASSDPRERLRDMISLPHRGRAAERAARIELAIRAWARRDALAQQVLDEADRSRLAYHEEAFRALGLKPAQARARAFITYSAEIGESLLHHHGTARARADRQREIERLVLQAPVTRAEGTPPAPAPRAARSPSAARGSPRARSAG